jgi:hypothetical protein
MKATFITLGILVGLFVLGFQLYTNIQLMQADPSFGGLTADLSIKGDATSTMTSINGTASTTVFTSNVLSEGGEDMVYYFTITASSSAVSILWSEEFSLDGIDWYGSTMPIEMQTATLNAVVSVVSYNPGTSTVGVIPMSGLTPTSTQKVVSSFNLPSRYRRVKASTLGGNALINVRGVVQLN